MENRRYLYFINKRKVSIMPRRKTKEEFIINVGKIHNYKYNYPNVIYINNKTKVKINCPEHGEFEQRPDMHIQGQGCPGCKKITLRKLNRFTTEYFSKMAKKIHGYEYDYSLSIYNGTDIKLKIICLKHGEFEQSPHNHINNKQGCPKCKFEKLADSKRLTNKKFIKISNEIHDYKYGYPNVNYKGNKIKVSIMCPIHGEFEQRPLNHMRGEGCPKCNTSRGEQKILKYLNRNEINYIHQKTFDKCKYKKKLRFDFYLSDKNIAIEFDGEQHFKPLEIFGGQKEFEKLIIKDDIKNCFCEENNISLLRISYEQINEIEQILNNNLK